MKIIVLVSACLLFGNLLQAQNLQGIWKMKMSNNVLDGARDPWLLFDTNSDSTYNGHSVTVSYTSFGAKPDTLVAALRGYPGKESKSIYLEEQQVINCKRNFSGGLEKFKLNHIFRKKRHYLIGTVESPMEFSVYINGKASAVKPTHIEFSKL